MMQENMRLGEQRCLGVKKDCCAVVDVVGELDGGAPVGAGGEPRDI